MTRQPLVRGIAGYTTLTCHYTAKVTLYVNTGFHFLSRCLRLQNGVGRSVTAYSRNSQRQLSLKKSASQLIFYLGLIAMPSLRKADQNFSGLFKALRQNSNLPLF